MNIDQMIKEAILEKNVAKREAYRAVKAEILLFKTKKDAKPVTDIEIYKIIRKLISQKEESISMYELNSKPDMQNRAELIKAYKEQNRYLKDLLPPEISKDDIQKAIYGLYPNGFTQKEMGKVIKSVKEIYPTADGKLIANTVKEYLI